MRAGLAPATLAQAAPALPKPGTCAPGRGTSLDPPHADADRHLRRGVNRRPEVPALVLTGRTAPGALREVVGDGRRGPGAHGDGDLGGGHVAGERRRAVHLQLSSAPGLPETMAALRLLDLRGRDLHEKVMRVAAHDHVKVTVRGHNDPVRRVELRGGQREAVALGGWNGTHVVCLKVVAVLRTSAERAITLAMPQAALRRIGAARTRQPGRERLRVTPGQLQLLLSPDVDEGTPHMLRLQPGGLQLIGHQEGRRRGRCWPRAAFFFGCRRVVVVLKTSTGGAAVTVAMPQAALRRIGAARTRQPGRERLRVTPGQLQLLLSPDVDEGTPHMLRLQPGGLQLIGHQEGRRRGRCWPRAAFFFGCRRVVVVLKTSTGGAAVTVAMPQAALRRIGAAR
eukprot:CAMPEP_0171174988 /NCGR_PEP_ID=MMETSP0790-20130122/11004_1 /TAXON_ID=2925 /ORGANISM="Alexandrium catenella, Strain OF101" /LENGTH=395 /DNA_ID=CAMNT_0011639865 /DNA_START=202 /DNA_END=1386 /DNA_ORIENTATION=+